MRFMHLKMLSCLFYAFVANFTLIFYQIWPFKISQISCDISYQIPKYRVISCGSQKKISLRGGQAPHIYARISDQLPSQAFCQYNSSKKREVGPKLLNLWTRLHLPSCSSFSAKHRSICIQTIVKLSHTSECSKNKMKILNVYVTSTTVT